MPDVWFTSDGPSEAPVLLCLHGIGSCAEAFEPQRPLMKRVRRRLVAWDAPGYRRSATPSQRYDLDDWADAAAKLIEHEADGAADVLGVSWGGVTATRLALRHPHLVRTLVLADTSVGSGTTPELAEAMRQRAADVDEAGLAAFAESRAPLLLTESAPASLVELVAELMVAAVRQPSYTWACDSMADTDHRAELSSIEVPTLVIVGREDQVTPLKASQRLVDGIPDATLVIIDDAGHLANQERPEQFNDAVAEFLLQHG